MVTIGILFISSAQRISYPIEYLKIYIFVEIEEKLNKKNREKQITILLQKEVWY